MIQPEPTSTGRKARTFVLTVMLGGLALGTASYACAPVSQRLTRPLTCPAGTVDSQVVTHVTRNDRGSIVTQFDFRCIDRDGGSTEPSGFVVIGALGLYGAGAVLLLMAIAFLRKKAGLSAATLAMTLLSGCELGTLTSDEFEARYPYGAGPMFSTGQAEHAGRKLAATLGREVRVTSVNASPEWVSFTVVAPGTRNDRDVYTVREEGVGDPTPIQTSEREGEADESFALTPEVLAKFAPIVREAPRRVGIADAHVESVSVSKNGATLEYRVDVESAHRRGVAHFDAAGAFIRSEVD